MLKYQLIENYSITGLLQSVHEDTVLLHNIMFKLLKMFKEVRHPSTSSSGTLYFWKIKLWTLILFMHFDGILKYVIDRDDI